MTQPARDERMYSRMMAEHFGISILESDARLLHSRIQILLATAHARGMEVEREGCAKACEDQLTWDLDDPGSTAAKVIRARGQQ